MVGHILHTLDPRANQVFALLESERRPEIEGEFYQNLIRKENNNKCRFGMTEILIFNPQL